MNNGDDTEGSTGPDAESGTASDETPTMMDNIFRPIKDEGTGDSAPTSNSPAAESSPDPAVIAPDDSAEVDVQVEQKPAPESVWRRKWFIGVVAALAGVAIGAVVWSAGLDDRTEQETPPLVATPEVSEPVSPEVTVTETVMETVDTTATATEMVQTTATETARVRVTATETWEIQSTTTETVEVTAASAPTVVVTVTATVVRQNSEGLMREAAIAACATAVEENLTSEYPDAEVDVPRGEALVAALRNDLDSWFIKLGARVDDAEQIVDCYVSGNDDAPSVDSILVR